MSNAVEEFKAFVQDRQPLDDAGLDLLFRKARTVNGWLDKPVDDDTLRTLHSLYILGATASNTLPARIVYVKSDAAKDRLRPCLMDGNVDKTMAAPVCAVIGYDVAFHEHLDRLYPQVDFKTMFAKAPEHVRHTVALRNGSLQGGYFMLAARALGLDCGPMSGFNVAKATDAFFPDSSVEANFLCNLGYGDPDTVYARNPRLDFDEVSRIV